MNISWTIFHAVPQRILQVFYFIESLYFRSDWSVSYWKIFFSGCESYALYMLLCFLGRLIVFFYSNRKSLHHFLKFAKLMVRKIISSFRLVHFDWKNVEWTWFLYMYLHFLKCMLQLIKTVRNNYVLGFWKTKQDKNQWRSPERSDENQSVSFNPGKRNFCFGGWSKFSRALQKF